MDKAKNMKILLWFKTKITIPLLIFGFIFIIVAYLFSSHFIENVFLGIGTNLFGIIVTVSFVQHIFDKQSEEKEKELEKEKIIRFSQIMNIRLEKYFVVFAQITTPISEYSKQNIRQIEPKLDFKFEDMKDLHFPCLLMSEKLSESAISVFYSEEKRIKEYMLRMLENIDFKHFSGIKDLLIDFVKLSEAYDVSNAILSAENTKMGDKKMSEFISNQISTNSKEHWIEKYEKGELKGIEIINYIKLYKLLQNELSILIKYKNKIQELTKD